MYSLNGAGGMQLGYTAPSAPLKEGQLSHGWTVSNEAVTFGHAKLLACPEPRSGKFQVYAEGGLHLPDCVTLDVVAQPSPEAARCTYP